MARASTEKGKRGEREVVTLANAMGVDACRTAQLQAGGNHAADVTLDRWPAIHLEVKRDERMSVDAMVRQAEGDARDVQVPCVAWRRNKGEWRADVPLQFFFWLLRGR